MNMNQDKLAIEITPRAESTWGEGYQDVEMVMYAPNLPGTEVNVRCPGDCKEKQRIYFTDSCEERNMFGSGTSCVDCPDNAECPGKCPML